MHAYRHRHTYIDREKMVLQSVESPSVQPVSIIFHCLVHHHFKIPADRQTVSQSDSRSVRQTVSQSVSRSVRQTVSQSVSQSDTDGRRDQTDH